ncbi:PREDICTED: glutathione S-transferase C-terminal domain-containing protein homolog [Wasmannia auropunctata]|uniref:glutathione S-transferase C-terminal domain-containing protein homolog n=1 Tax=Wasmannia auropunctata TaxID=64793 RepID=UPI0005ED951D|nr:PREDICTED: glutathione S-transferase C-terminal domain-containing protein homolog [Wasmannia auropunctata]
MSEVYLAIFSMADLCLAPIETLVTLFTIKYCESLIGIKLIPSKQDLTERAYAIDLTNFAYEIVNVNEIPYYASSCELPNVTVNESSCMAGLCTVLRQIVKSSSTECSTHDCTKLLGFKGSCLMACSEASVWTKFCEIDLILTLKSLDLKDLERSELPVSLARFECHMSQPVKLHNLYKYTMCKKFAALDISRRDETGLPEHAYAEGACVTLSDIIIFVCMHILLNAFSSHTISKLVPLTVKWYDRMLEDQFITKCLSCLPSSKSRNSDVLQYTLPVVVNESLYKSDPKRYKPRSRIYTRQEDIEHSLRLIEDMKITVQLDVEPFGVGVNLDWSDVPFDATPEGGLLPLARLRRKQEQLQNLCKPVLKLAKAGDTIVDFCSGSGHLGILIAYFLPRCTVILLENKEESLNRAKERVRRLKLTNVKFCQCNLDYFKGDFDIGTSLHACGLATDLVIQRCIRKNAIFVSCPCCYGSLQDCHQLTYPRSDVFRGRVNNKEYSYLSHAADQTHDELNVKTKQGYRCMAIIDTDRKLFAEQFGYKVYLAKLIPETCTLKNHLLVGLPKDKLTHGDSCDN